MPTIDVSDLRPTIIPKSDQLNAEQLLGGSMTITVSGVSVSSSPEQPVTVHYDAENGRPFKPCKTMRKLLVFAWGPDGNEWAGRSMTVYNDPSVKFGGDEVGGIRISHLSHIERDIEISLTATRGKKALYRVHVLQTIESATNLDALKDAFAAAYRAADAQQKPAVKQRYESRKAELQQPKE